MPLPPTANSVMLAFWQAIADAVAVAVACVVHAAIKDIKKPAAQSEDGADRVGAARRDGQAVNGGQLAGVVVDLDSRR